MRPSLRAKQMSLEDGQIPWRKTFRSEDAESGFLDGLWLVQSLLHYALVKEIDDAVSFCCPPQNF